MRIEEIDKNLFNGSSVDMENTDFYSATEAPIKILGCYQSGVDGQLAHRIPPKIAEDISAQLTWLNKTHSGVRVVLATNSPYISFLVSAAGYGRTVDDTLAGGAGIFVTSSEEGRDQSFKGRISPTFNQIVDEMNGKGANFSGTVQLRSEKMHQVIVWLPTLTDYKELYIGVQKGSVVEEFGGYRYKKPVVFYGSSITMGCGASAPVNTYPALISRRFDTDFINLGFSGNAKGEATVAEYIASLDMSAFVLDYDHNAPTVEHLESTHEEFYNIIRAKNPDLPIIIMSRPDAPDTLDAAKRLDVIFNTFLKARKAGDRVWFINGSNIFDGPYRDCCTHEGCHPNDLGYSKMADVVSAIVKEFLR